MKPKRVLLLAVQPPLLCETLAAEIQKRLGSCDDLVLLKSWRDDNDLLVATQRHNAHIVILTVRLEERVPRPVSRLLDEFPEVDVVALDMGAERVRIYPDPLNARSLSNLSFSALLDDLFGRINDDGEMAWD